MARAHMLASHHGRNGSPGMQAALRNPVRDTTWAPRGTAARMHTCPIRGGARYMLRLTGSLKNTHKYTQILVT